MDPPFQEQVVCEGFLKPLRLPHQQWSTDLLTRSPDSDLYNAGVSDSLAMPTPR
jgi:hypothetical protein